MFEVLGFKVKDYELNISGCGMNMVFYVNYFIMYDFKRIGLIMEKECDYLV